MGSLGSGGLPGNRLDSDRHLEEFLLAFWLSLSSVVSDPGVVDDSWIERLADRKPGGTFFGDYARLSPGRSAGCVSRHYRGAL